MLPSITLDPRHYKRFSAGYPWIYANEIIQSNETKSLQAGQVVQLLHLGKPLALGYYNRHSLIAFRVLSYNPEESIDADFFRKKLVSALRLRELLYPLPFYRLVHAEGDFLPGLIIDRFNDIFVIQTNTQGMNKLHAPLIEAMVDLFKPRTLYFKQEGKVREAEGLEQLPPQIIGENIQDIPLVENGLHFNIGLDTSQKTGWFFDHTENRKLIHDLIVASHPNTQGEPNTQTQTPVTPIQTVIDYFCYSGGFALQAAKAGAKSVIAIDRSKSALDNASKSAKLNGLASIIECVEAETFQDMEQRISNNQKFDLVILDPPAFVKSKKDLASGLKGYEKLLIRGLKLCNQQGFLLVASCSYHVKLDDLAQCLRKALVKTGQKARIIKKLSAGPDHPIQPHLEESEYLKGFLIALDL